MTELEQKLSNAIERMEQKQQLTMKALEKRMENLEKEVQGCRGLQSELERLLGELEASFR